MNNYRKILIFVTLLTVLASGCSKQPSLPATPTSLPATPTSLPATPTSLPATPTSLPATPTSLPFTQIVAFGDSLSDNGNGARISKKDIENNVPNAWPNPPSHLYWEGRWSNGPTAVEVMAQQLHVKLLDYAVGGAQSGLYNNDNIGEMNLTGLLSQVENFQIDLSGKKADPYALYFIFISANDFFINFWDGYSGSYSDLADEALKNIQTVATRLSELGAKRFMVVNSYDLTIVPNVVTNNGEGVAKEFKNRIDTQLQIIMNDLSKKLNIEVTVFDIQGVSDKILSDPQKYGLKTLADTCMVDFIAKTACNNPDEYYFWDPIHPTRRFHQIVGEAMTSVYGK